MFNKKTPEAGSLLIAEPFMLDINFQRAVILLCAHNQQEGTLGYVINQPATLLLSDVMSELPEADFPIYIGGPVATDTLHFIHKSYDKLQSGESLGNGIFWGGNFETLKVLIQNNAISSDEIKFFIGYSGWEIGQLEGELSENTWAVSNEYHPDISFVQDGENLWKEALVTLGPKYTHVANFPKNPTWN